MDDKYSCREINLIIAPMKKTLEEIHEQVIKTNGRVSNLERWKSFIQGGMAFISLMVAPVLVYIIIGWIK
jgi:hypothetical protein